MDRETGETEQLSGEAWLGKILFMDLDEGVPDDVAALFDVARGAMVYGWFFYPLYTLGAEQLTRVGEAAVDHIWSELEAPEETETFAARLEWFRAHGFLSEELERRLHSLRKLRNSASHPSFQSIFTQALALKMLHWVADDINQLFGVTAADD